jgi:DNA adenine methylase
MAYVGGKATKYEHIINVLNNKKYDGYNYIEPFVGYCHILKRVINKKSYTACDNNPLVISLLTHIQTKKTYPKISKEQYYKLKKQYYDGSLPKDKLYLAAFAAFCYSYNGKEFAGYTPSSDGRNYVSERKNHYDFLKQNDTFKKTKLKLLSFFKLNPKSKSLIYCDPPYQNTTSYGKIKFDHEMFWEKVRQLHNNGHVVFVSEYSAPKNFKSIAKVKKFSSLGGKGAVDIKTEKLFVYKN